MVLPHKNESHLALVLKIAVTGDMSTKTRNSVREVSCFGILERWKMAEGGELLAKA